MAEILKPHKTDSQKSWAFRDRKLRDAQSKRKLRSPHAFVISLWLYRFFGPWPLRAKPRSGHGRAPFRKQPWTF
jgi:hypothetical protein